MTDKLTWDSAPAIDEAPESSPAKMTWDAAPAVDDTPPKPQYSGIVGDARAGVESAAKGFGRTDDAYIEAFQDHPWIQSYFKLDKMLNSTIADAAHDDSYNPAPFDYRDPSTYKNIGNAAVRGLVSNAPTIIAGVAGGPLGGAAAGYAQNYGNNLDARLANQPDGQAPTIGDKAAAAGSAILGGVLTSKLPIPGANAAVSGGVLPVLGSVGKSIVRDGAITGGTDLIQQGANTAGTANGLTIDPNEAINSAAVGGAMGAGMHAVTAVSKAGSDTIKDNVANKTYGTVDPNAAAALKDRFLQTPDLDTSTSKGRYDAMMHTENGIRQDLTDITKGGIQSAPDAPILKADLGDLQPFNRRVVTDGIKTVSDGKMLNAGQKEALEGILGDGNNPDPSSNALLDLIKQHDTLNLMKSVGKMDDKAGTFVGGADASTIGHYLNPAAALKGVVKNAIPGVLGTGAVAGLAEHYAPHLVESALHGIGAAAGTAVPAGIAAMMAARKIAQGVSSIKSTNDPIGMLNRFSANNPADATIPVSRDLNSNIAKEAAASARIRQAINEAQPMAPADVPVAQPKFNPAPGFDPRGTVPPTYQQAPMGGLPEGIDPAGIRAKALLALKARMEAQSTPQADPAPDQAQPGSTSSAGAMGSDPQAKGPTFTHRGREFPIPAGVRNLPAYIASSKVKQDFIGGTIEEALNKTDNVSTQNALAALDNQLAFARNRDNAKGFVNAAIRNSHPDDHTMIAKMFDEDFLKNWSKQSGSRFDK